jgi:hypothetical protein
VGKDDGKAEPQPGNEPGSPRRKSRDSPASSASTGASSASSRTDPLDVEPGAWQPPEESPPTRTAADLNTDDVYEPPPPELIEWTPERASAVVRGLGFGLHVLDPASRTDGGDQLWRWTKDDALEAGEPLARILNRYAPARRLAGFSDEAELAVIMGAYVRRNIADRGRLVALQEALAEEAARAETWVREPPPSPQPPPGGFAPWAGSEPTEGA